MFTIVLKLKKMLLFCEETIQEIMVYFIGKLNQKPFVLAFDQFDHLVILDKSI
jgi:hypothetical protein